MGAALEVLGGFATLAVVIVTVAALVSICPDDDEDYYHRL